MEYSSGQECAREKTSGSRGRRTLGHESAPRDQRGPIRWRYWLHHGASTRRACATFVCTSFQGARLNASKLIV
eukprot:4003596-Pyramimonas_sp.AAC.1